MKDFQDEQNCCFKPSQFQKMRKGLAASVTSATRRRQRRSTLPALSVQIWTRIWRKQTGRFAIVTGDWVKIGPDSGLQRVLSGVVTTRSLESDFINWSHRLQIYGLDLWNVGSILQFVEYVKSSGPHLDILINNSAPTLWLFLGASSQGYTTYAYSYSSSESSSLPRMLPVSPLACWLSPPPLVSAAGQQSPFSSSS